MGKKQKEHFSQEGASEKTGSEALNLPKEGKSHKRKKYILPGMIFAVILAAGIAAFGYYQTALYYRTHFFPNTVINGVDCSRMEAAAVAEMLDARLEEYSLEVTGRDYRTGESGAQIGKIFPSDIQLAYQDTRKEVEALLAGQEEFQWIQAWLGQQYSHSMERNVLFDEDMLNSMVKSWDACKKANMVKAQDAYISEYSEARGGYEIIPETAGTQLDVEQVLQLVSEALGRQEKYLDLEQLSCYQEAAVRQDDTKLNSIVDKVNQWLGTRISYDWNGSKIELDHRILHEWITLEDDSPVLDEEKVAAFVKEQAAAHDTYGKKKSFITTLGEELTLNSRNYGWKTDTENETKELIRLIYQGSTTDREPVYSIKARQKGENDIGSSYVEADLTNQHLYLYQDGELVLETDFVSGTMISTYDCVTPEGIFGLSYKTRNAVLRGATYQTPVSYWMPFYGNYGMHDANWRGSFGGDIFITNGSHGCINLPVSMAEQIYQYVSEGFPVVCYYYGGAPYIGPPAVENPEGEGSEEGYEEGGEGQEPEPPQEPELPVPDMPDFPDMSDIPDFPEGGGGIG